MKRLAGWACALSLLVPLALRAASPGDWKGDLSHHVLRVCAVSDLLQEKTFKELLMFSFTKLVPALTLAFWAWYAFLWFVLNVLVTKRVKL